MQSEQIYWLWLDDAKRRRHTPRTYLCRTTIVNPLQLVGIPARQPLG